MAIFNETQQNRSRRGPSETVLLSDTLAAAIWSTEDENGQVRYHWDMSRVSAEDKSKTYKTKRVESLLELPAFTARLSEAFANSSAIPAEIRDKLAAQAVALNEYVERVEAESERKVNGQANGNRVFAS